MIIADTGAILALIDADDKHHAVLSRAFEPDQWMIPWAVLPEVDYLVATHLGARTQEAFLSDVADGAFSIEWGREEDVQRARDLCLKYRTLRMGLVDGVVMAVAERLKAEAIATLDVRHFGAVKLRLPFRLLPRDAAR
ncbi:MAG: PIN domain-containing protein [Deltaproteobacteria bacterium]|nr:PIN domain-containing protein [Deltaproteobacteria bacterium]